MPDFTEDQTPDRLSVVNPPSNPSGIPQFATAEYAHIPGTERCRICNNFISGEYYRINNQMACATCAAQSRAGQPADSHSAFARGLLLGIGAALIGLIVYATVVIATGWTIGYLALGVGWLVAKAIMKGSNGLGGRRYQIAAVLLTYGAISMAAIPIGISYALKEKPATANHRASDNSLPEDDDTAQSAQPTKSKPTIQWGSLVGQLLLMGLISPFSALQDPGRGAIGLFILFIGLRIAWQITTEKPLAVEGPYSSSTA